METVKRFIADYVVRSRNFIRVFVGKEFVGRRDGVVFVVKPSLNLGRWFLKLLMEVDREGEMIMRLKGGEWVFRRVRRD
jgi:hypothetical protein